MEYTSLNMWQEKNSNLKLLGHWFLIKEVSLHQI